MTCARPLKRIFANDLEHCLIFGGEMTVFAAIIDAPAIERMPTNLSLLCRCVF